MDAMQGINTLNPSLIPVDLNSLCKSGLIKVNTEDTLLTQPPKNMKVTIVPQSVLTKDAQIPKNMKLVVVPPSVLPKNENQRIQMVPKNVRVGSSILRPVDLSQVMTTSPSLFTDLPGLKPQTPVINLQQSVLNDLMNTQIPAQTPSDVQKGPVMKSILKPPTATTRPITFSRDMEVSIYEQFLSSIVHVNHIPLH